MSKPNVIAAACLLLLAACGGGGSNHNAPPSGNPRVDPPASSVVATVPYHANAPHAGDLRTCTYAGSATRNCTLATLPFLGMEAPNPSIDDVLDRTLVSHPWMGDNLAAVLAELPDDVLPLFRSVTAVVIASDVRPAHYTSESGAIYLDPQYLWLSTAERDTVSTAPDPRSAFGLDLAFQMPWRYVRNNQPLTVFLNPDGSRDLTQIVEIMGYLLYHELAHAADFMPAERFAVVSTGLTASAAIAQQPPLSSQLVGAFPLTSETLTRLAAVSFLGANSSAAERALQPADLVDAFVNDGAVQYYAYTSQYEDFATLFETAMMKWHFGYDKDTAITNRPASGDVDAAVVTWGRRSRLADQPVAVRVREVGQGIYPGDLADFEAFLDAEPPGTDMLPGATWAQNLNLGGAAALSAPASGFERRVADDFLRRVPIR